MVYHRKYNYPNTRGNRTWHAAGVAGMRGMAGWIVAAVMAGGKDHWVAFYFAGFGLIILAGHFYVKNATVDN